MITNPLTPEQNGLLDSLLPTLTSEQRSWLAGYLAGLQAAQGVPQPPSPAATPADASPAPSVSVLYGSQTGNALGLAKRLAARVEQAGFSVALQSLADYDTRRLKQERLLLLITSTQGDGDPPDNAIAFWEWLGSRKAPKLAELRHAVLALGDSSYEHFCKTGRDFDLRLRELGSEALHPLVECDLDFEAPAQGWMDGVLAALGAALPAGRGVGTPPAGGTAAVAAPQEYSRSQPFPAEILEQVELHGRDAGRSTRHVELSLAGSGLGWEPGDSLGVYAHNSGALVEQLLEATDWDPGTALDDGLPLVDALVQRYEITVLTRPLLQRIAETTGHAGLKDLLRPAREAELRAYLEGRDLLDLARDFGLRGVPARDVVSALRRLPPRLYSLASAYSADPEQAEITVRLVEYAAHGRTRHGVCTAFIAERGPGETLPVFVQSNPNFRLPADPEAPLIMIGPGTGVAPFRAFVQERAETGARGPSWLFFGDRHFRTDFLYQTDWQRFLKQGVLSRMDVAFSRDRAEKVYVQHRILEHAGEVYAWLQQGACVYVCGDEKHMAPDVHEALAAVLMREGGSDRDAAEAHLAEMRQQRRYQRDVY